MDCRGYGSDNLFLSDWEMNSKEYDRMVADARRSVSRKYGFRQSSYINFKIDSGYFFCIYFLTDESQLTVKPMYADDLWWDIWDASENRKGPLSLRGTGAYSLPGQVLASYEIPETTNQSELANRFERVFQDAATVILIFLTDNPDADIFYPDESKMMHDPDRLLYLITLIHNEREDEVLKIIKEARKHKHSCMFQSGMFSDSYTYIRHWCKREQTIMRIRNAFASVFNNIVKIRAYALMALGRNNKKDTIPDSWDVRLLDGSIVMALCFSIIFLWQSFTLGWITFAVYFILVCFMDFGKRSDRYCIRFGKLPDKTRLKWKVCVWIFIITIYIYLFTNLLFES